MITADKSHSIIDNAGLAVKKINKLLNKDVNISLREIMTLIVIILFYWQPYTLTVKICIKSVLL